MEPMIGRPHGQAWPAPIGPSDVAERCLALVVLIRFEAVRSERRGREREREEIEGDGKRGEGMAAAAHGHGSDAVTGRRRAQGTATEGRERESGGR